MMDTLKENIDALESKLCFVQNYTKPMYNPMEQFVDYVSTKEIVHSKIIASLFDPFGEHGLGMRFLLNFLKRVCIEVPLKTIPNQLGILEPDIKDIAVFTEKTISNSRRIDILVTAVIGGKRHAIIIENKLNGAIYQPNQLEDYKNAYLENNYETRVICVHKIKDNKDKPDGADMVMYADDVASVIDDSIKSCQGEIIVNIKSYSNYLKNLSKQNTIMDNAEKLFNAELTSGEFCFIKSLIDAYNQLPRVCAQHLKKMVDVGLVKYADKASISNLYNHYCYLWNVKEYGDSKPFWVAVGFSHDSASFYLVSSDKHGWNEDRKIKFADSLGFAKSSTDNEGTWYKPKDLEEFQINFEKDGKPNFDFIKGRVENILEKIHKFEL